MCKCVNFWIVFLCNSTDKFKFYNTHIFATSVQGEFCINLKGNLNLLLNGTQCCCSYDPAFQIFKAVNCENELELKNRFSALMIDSTRVFFFSSGVISAPVHWTVYRQTPRHNSRLQQLSRIRDSCSRYSQGEGKLVVFVTVLIQSV